MYNRLRIDLIFGLFASPIVIAFGIYFYLQDNAIITHGQTTLGTISSQYTTRNDSSSSPSHTLVVDYTVAGKSYRNNFPADANKYANLPTGSQVKVHYLPSDPNSAMLGKSATSSIVVIIAGVVMFFISLAYRLYHTRKKSHVG